jgi:hypothetical protein
MGYTLGAGRVYQINIFALKGTVQQKVRGV